MPNKTTTISQALHLALNAHNAAGAPYFNGSAANNIQLGVENFYAKLPNYEEMFANPAGEVCNANVSLTSPAAYFVYPRRVTTSLDRVH